MAASSSAEIATPYSLLALSFNAFLEHERAQQHQYTVEEKKPAPELLEDFPPLMPSSATSSPSTPAAPALLKDFLNPVITLASEDDLMNHLQKFAGLKSWLQTQPNNPSTLCLIQIFDFLDTQNKEHLLATLKRYLTEDTEMAKKIQQDAASLLRSALNTPTALANAAFIFKLDSVSSLALQLNTISAQGAKLIARALTTNSTLTSLDLGHNKSGVEGAAFFARALTKNLTLTSLSLRNNDIGVEGARPLAQALTKNLTLTFLDLRYNHIGDEGAKLIAQALSTNPTLTFLNLGSNYISVEGVEPIAQVLSTNSTLTFLDLGDNRTGDEGAKLIAQALSTNSTLTSLVLGRNNITDGGAKLIVPALSTNSTLTSLELGGNNISSEILQQIEDLLERNRKNNVQRGFILMEALLNIVNKPQAPDQKSLVDSFLEESAVIEETNNDADSSSEMKARGPQLCR